MKPYFVNRDIPEIFLLLRNVYISRIIHPRHAIVEDAIQYNQSVLSEFTLFSSGMFRKKITSSLRSVAASLCRHSNTASVVMPEKFFN